MEENNRIIKHVTLVSMEPVSATKTTITKRVIELDGVGPVDNKPLTTSFTTWSKKRKKKKYI